jgi:hypothetical protein
VIAWLLFADIVAVVLLVTVQSIRTWRETQHWTSRR